MPPVRTVTGEDSPVLWSAQNRESIGGRRRDSALQLSMEGSFPNFIVTTKLYVSVVNLCSAVYWVRIYSNSLMFRALADIVFPKYCIKCGCWMIYDKNRISWCGICRMFWPDLRGSIGQALMKERLPIAWGQVGFRLTESKFLEEQVRRFKYRGDYHIAWHLGRWLAMNCEGFPKPNGELVLVPIPLHWKRKLNRGYNQSEWLARGISSVWKVPIDMHALQRVKSGKSLTGMSRKEREEKLRETYVFSETTRVRAGSVVLVDDVLTTGTTFNMCAAALKDSPYRVVGAMSLALA